MIIIDWGFNAYHMVLVENEAMQFMDQGDELHAVDLDGIIANSCEDEIYQGSISVGSTPFFENTEDPFILYMSEGLDDCQESNYILPGYNKSNESLFLHYDYSDDEFYELDPVFASWNGTFGDTPQDTLNFQYYSAADDKTYFINESIPFTPSMIEGDAMFPIEYTYDENNYIDGEIECEFNPYAFEFWGSITSTVQDMQLGDQFATFVNGECRSLDSALESPFGDPVVLMNIYGNAALSIIESFDQISTRHKDNFITSNQQTRNPNRFNIYRDGVLLETNIDNFYYIDDDILDEQFYCYQIMLIDENGNEILESMEQCIDLGLDLSVLQGDLNEDGIVNILDIVILINIVLNGIDDPNADLNEDGIVNILDIVMLINMIINN